MHRDTYPNRSGGADAMETIQESCESAIPMTLMVLSVSGKSGTKEVDRKVASEVNLVWVF